MNYGAIGTILGHELTHGFDNSGRLYDGDGNLRQWWSNETVIEYKDKVECFIDHYSSYHEAEVIDYFIILYIQVFYENFLLMLAQKKGQRILHILSKD